MRILALIAARGGSKRLPGKNIRRLGGKPLIVWSIDVCDGLSDICDILVSTDDPAIADVARNSGALVPWLRPAELATDAMTSKEVALHALRWYEDTHGAVDGLMLLQPTSPFRSRHTIQRGIDIFRKSQKRPVVGISAAAVHPMWCLKLVGDGMVPFVEGGGLHLRSQELPPAYAVNGALYLISPDDLRQRESFYSDDMVPLLIESTQEAIDIDTEFDWQVAEAFCR
ncbi:MAG: acylneuraminate cytidylyltransferase family protein [Propionivibrio sp.]|uniref:acylneuraminate cytidylyltransferase family protein n=1 Tax=Propionivibrio sp. TaxID=2212460 RepID=UPI0025DCA940|nr:acylneuraminate cytidylyltransferase family protein [Propionivibrio sp.]MBK7354710.1 acylneuraminate cytidylyltransferase family protein [Propionivibrio sp.]MBK8402081.1 acylneuraminate cytidylyltransferase family protein [Propionivibrio sp.]